jgi:hypothetical protein
MENSNQEDYRSDKAKEILKILKENRAPDTSMPSDWFSWRPFIQDKLCEAGRCIRSPFFTIDFLVLYKDLLNFLIENDSSFLEFIESKKINKETLGSFNRHQTSKIIFDFYVLKPEKLYRLIKYFRRDSNRHKKISKRSGVKKIIESQFSKDSKDNEARKKRIEIALIGRRFKQSIADLERSKIISELDHRANTNYVYVGEYTNEINNQDDSVELSVPVKIFKERMKICEACEFWQKPSQTNLQGQCTKCGCSGAKQWLSLSKCPIDKWLEYDPEKNEAKQTNDKNEVENKKPGMLQMAKNFGSSMVKWASSGFNIVTDEMHKFRLDICNKCPNLNKNGFGGTGQCTVCGCSVVAKTKLPTERCPLDYWLPVNPNKNEAQDTLPE